MTTPTPPSPRIQQRLIAAGVRNLQKYGYREVTPENILTQPIYAAFFREMLKDNLGQGFDTHIESVLGLLPASAQ